MQEIQTHDDDDDDDAALQRLLRSADAPSCLRLEPPQTLAERGAARHHRRIALGAGLAVVLLAAGVLIGRAVLERPGPPDDLLVAAGPAPEDRQVISLDGEEPKVCGTAPLAALTAEPGAERADTTAAAALRAGTVLDGMSPEQGPLPATGWIELSSTVDEVSFGHRTGRLGIDRTVRVQRQPQGTWQLTSSGVCGGLTYSGGRRAARLSGYEAPAPDRLTVHWLGGACDDDKAMEVRVVEEADSVSVLVVPAHDGSESCVDLGVPRRASLALSTPLGDRPVLNAGFVPARAVPVQELSD